MKRKDLEGLGLEKDVVDKVMALHQTDVEENKKILTTKDEELSRSKNELEGANKTIDDLQSTVKKFEGIDIETLKTEFEEKENNYKTQLEQQAKDFAIDKLFGTQGFVSESAKKGAIIDFKEKNLTFDKGNFLGADDFFKQLKENDPLAFAKEEAKPKGTLTTGANHDDGDLDSLEAQMDAVLGLTPNKEE